MSATITPFCIVEKNYIIGIFNNIRILTYSGIINKANTCQLFLTHCLISMLLLL